MELPCKLLEKITSNTRSISEEHMLIVVGKSIYEENLSQPLQTKNNQSKIAVTFFNGYNTIFNVTNEQKILFNSINKDDDFNQKTIPPGAYGLENLNNEILSNINEEGFITEVTYPFTIRLNFSIVGSIKKISSNTKSTQIAFTPDDSIRNLLGFKPKVKHKEYSLSDYPVDISSIDNILLEGDTAQSLIFKAQKCGIVRNWPMTVIRDTKI